MCGCDQSFKLLFGLISLVIGERKVGDQLNLERAMSSHSRFGGHFVQV